jgi:hypothetical protein
VGATFFLMTYITLLFQPPQYGEDRVVGEIVLEQIPYFSGSRRAALPEHVHQIHLSVVNYDISIVGHADSVYESECRKAAIAPISSPDRLRFGILRWPGFARTCSTYPLGNDVPISSGATFTRVMPQMIPGWAARESELPWQVTHPFATYRCRPRSTAVRRAGGVSPAAIALNGNSSSRM